MSALKRHAQARLHHCTLVKRELLAVKQEVIKEEDKQMKWEDDLADVPMRVQSSVYELPVYMQLESDLKRLQLKRQVKRESIVY